jgi:hypothetical protein
VDAVRFEGNRTNIENLENGNHPVLQAQAVNEQNDPLKERFPKGFHRRLKREVRWITCRHIPRNQRRSERAL